MDAKDQQLAPAPGLMAILHYFEQQTQLRFEPHWMPWNRAQYFAMNGAGILFRVSKSAQRLLHFDYSLAVNEEKIWAISYGKQASDYHHLNDLRGKHWV